MNNVVGLLVIYLIFLMVVLFWYQIAAFTSAEGMLMAAITVMAVVFCSGLAGNVQIAYVLLGIIGVFGILLFLFNFGCRRYKKQKTMTRILEFFSPATVMISIIFCVSTIAFRRALYTYPDEVFQWGSSLKYMFYTHLLPYGEAFTGEDITMSFCTMFQYLWVGAFSYVESNGFVGNFLLTLIPIMLPMKDKGWKQWKNVALYGIIVVLSFNLLSYIKYYTLLQDYVLPMWTGGIIAWLLWKKEEKTNWLLLLPSLIVIGAMKSLVGPLFAVMILGLAFINELFFGEDYGTKVSFLKRILNVKYLWFLAGAAAPFAINAVWSKVIYTNVLNRTVGSAEKNVGGILSGVLQRAFTVLESTQRNVPFVSFVIFWVLCILAVVTIRNLIKEEKLKSRFTVSFILYAIGFIGYLAVMAYAYLYVFGVGDSSVVAGLERYLAYYMLIGVVPLISILFIKDRRFAAGKWMKVVPVCLILVVTFGTGGNFISKATSLGRELENAWLDRVEIKEKVEKFNELAEADGKVLVIGRLSGNDSKMYTYELGNRYIWNADSYMLELRDGTYTSCLNVTKYPELIVMKGYRYVWFQDSKERNDEFIRLRHVYGFDSTDEGELYELVNENGKYRFEYLGCTEDEEVSE